MDNAWKNSLRERFSDYSAPEPEGLWEGIEQGMAGKPRRKMLPVWLATGLAAAAAVALVVFLPTRKAAEPSVLQDQARYAESVEGFPVETGNDDDASAVSVDAAPTSPSSPAPTGDLDAPASTPAPFAVSSRRTLLAEAEPTVSVPVSEETVPDAVSDPHSRHDRESVVGQENAVTEEKEVGEMPDQVGHDGKVDQVGHDGKVDQVGQDVRPRKRFSIGAYHEGGGQSSQEQSRGFGLARTGEYLTRSTPGYHDSGHQPSYGMTNMLSANRASEYWATHHAPVRVGVTAGWQMTEHLSLVSGVNWTSLSSQFDEETEGQTRVHGTQDLGYLGVPLRVEAGWEPVKRLRLYAGAGGMVEKGLLATVKADSYLGKQESTTVTKHPDTGGLLWSVGAEAGAEYRIGKVFGIYLAPGIEYHFDNGAEVRSAYTEKPLHWNVDLGVRFHFGGE
jgi:hypothetical protein